LPSTYKIIREQLVLRNIEEVFEFFSRPENLQVLTPDWLDFRIVQSPVKLTAGSLINYRLRWHGLPIRWTTEITEWHPPFGFRDMQLSGPYALWDHKHRFVAEDGGTRIYDDVSYALPFGVAGRLVGGAFVRRDVEALFDYRQQAMRKLMGPG
jgi:hypothetical protein